MNTTAKRLGRRGAAVLSGLATLLVLVAMPTPAVAATTDMQTATFDLGDLDASGSGTFEQFDPALGQLTSVAITAEVTMNFQVCMTNLSAEAITLPSGIASGEAPVTFAGGAVAEATGEMTVPESTLQANEGGDECTAWRETGQEPATDDTVLIAESDVSTYNTTLTDADALAPYIGTGTVAFDYTASSDSDLAQPSEWTIIYLADGVGEATVTYTYEPGESPSPSPSCVPSSMSPSPSGATDECPTTPPPTCTPSGSPTPSVGETMPPGCETPPPTCTPSESPMPSAGESMPPGCESSPAPTCVPEGSPTPDGSATMPPGCPAPDGPEGSLAGTGGPSGWWLGAGALLIVVGAASLLIVRTRR